jgi:hypothetical protein
MRLMTLANDVFDRLHHTLPGFRMREAVRSVWVQLDCASPRPLIEPYTMMPRPRLVRLEQSVREIARNGIPGDVVECGCARGGSAALAALSLKREHSTKRIYLFDTFEGLPAPTSHDPASASEWTGKCAGSLQEVQELFERLDIMSQTVFVKGLFQNTLPSEAPDQIAFLHMDGDWYESTMTILLNLWDRVSQGGIVQVDDYGDWEGCRRAFDEFVEARGITLMRHSIDGGAIWVRKP